MECIWWGLERVEGTLIRPSGTFPLEKGEGFKGSYFGHLNGH